MTYSIVLLVNALGLLGDIEANAENSRCNTTTALAAQGCLGRSRLVDVQKSGVNLGVARQSVSLEVAAANL